MTKTITLHCEAGKHEWQRPAQKGRAPFNCPEHSANKTKPKSQSGLDKARAARQSKKNAEEKIWADKIQAVLDDPKMNEFLYDSYSSDCRKTTKTKLIYIQEQLTKYRDQREPSDIYMLETMRAKIMKDPFNRSGHLL